MCRNGVNLTQFKLSAHQLKKFADVLEESLKQWEDVLAPLGFENLATLAADARTNAAVCARSIDALLEQATAAEASDDVTITPL